MGHNGVSGRVYAKQDKWSAQWFEYLDQRVKAAEAKLGAEAKALTGARKELDGATRKLKDRMDEIDRELEEANAKLNFADFALGLAAAAATVTGVVAAIAGAPVVAAGAGLVVVVVGVGGMITDSQRPPEVKSAAEVVKDTAGKFEAPLDAVQNSLDGAAAQTVFKSVQTGAQDVLKVATIAERPVAEVLSKAAGPISGALTTYDRLSAAQTEAYRLPDIDADGALSKFEVSLNVPGSDVPISADEKIALNKLMRDSKKAQEKYREAERDYESARKDAARENATWIDYLKKAEHK